MGVDRAAGLWASLVHDSVHRDDLGTCRYDSAVKEVVIQIKQPDIVHGDQLQVAHRGQ